MGDVISLFGGRLPAIGIRAASGDHGTVHVWYHGDGEFLIMHESSSGSSWGGAETFDNAADAVAGAYRSARQYGSECDVFIPDAVLAMLPGGAA